MTAILLFACVAALGGCDRQSRSAGQEQALSAPSARNESKNSVGLESASGLRAELIYRFAGSAAPDASFAGADGREVRLGDFAGRPLLVNLWASWCAPCKAEMPTLDNLAALEEGQVTVIAVSQDLQGSKAAAPFFAAARIANLELYTDPQNRLWEAVGRGALPTTILYDSQGREVWRIVGGVEWDDAEVAKLLREAR